MSTRPLIKESLFILNFCALNPINSSAWKRAIAILVLVLYTYFFIELLLQLFLHWDNLDTVDGLSGIGMIYQVSCKNITMLVKKEILLNVLHKFKRFWPLDQHSVELQHEIKNTLTFIKKVAKIFLVVLLICVAMYVLKPLLTTARTLPIETYHPADRSKSFSYQLMYAFQILCMVSGCAYMLGFDGLLISFVIQIMWELKAIKEKFSTLTVASDTDRDDTSCIKKVIQLIDQHNLVLECIKDLTNIYSNMLLIQFSASLICINATLLSIVVGGFPPDLPHLIKFSTYLMTIFSQLYIYCAVGSYLVTESESLSGAVYESPWWIKTQPNLRKALSLVIQRSNKAEKLRAGGMLTLNLETFTAIVKLCLSFLTLLQGVYTRTK